VSEFDRGHGPLTLHVINMDLLSKTNKYSAWHRYMLPTQEHNQLSKSDNSFLFRFHCFGTFLQSIHKTGFHFVKLCLPLC